MARTDQIQIGRRGEFLAAYILETYGITTTHVDLQYDDLWCRTHSGELFRVQVKSTLKPIAYTTDPEKKRYQFWLGDSPPYHGIYVCVALDVELCLAFRDDRAVKTFKMRDSCFTEQKQTDSIREAFSL